MVSESGSARSDMAYISDRSMVESVLPCHLMLSVVMNGAEPDDPEAVKCIALLRSAAYEAVESLPTEKGREKILRRSERAYQDVARQWSGEGHSVGKFGLIVYYWLRGMMEAGYVILSEDGPFQEAMELLLPGLQSHSEIEAVDVSAQKQSRKFHAKLQSLGYYRDAVI